MNNKIRVLHLTTHDEICGIAKYQEQFIEDMKHEEDIENIIFDLSPNQTRFMTKQQYAPVVKHFESMLKEANILHIQHELAFYKHRELSTVVGLAHALKKPVIVTIHTALDVEYKKARLQGHLPKYFISYLRQLKLQKKFESIHLNPLKKADLVIVHNKTTKDSLVVHGFDAAKIKVITMPIPKINFAQKSHKIKQEMNIKENDVLVCTVGFISKTKGTDQAIKALRLLPQNFKLVIIGGTHPDSRDTAFLDSITDYIIDNNLVDRVYITGYIEDDNELNAMIRECDICVYPYDAGYYSYVSSAALSNALANHKAVITYPTPTFYEINNNEEIIKFCKTPNYYELAREIKRLDIKKYSQLASKYANKYTYDKEAIKFADIYRQVLKNKLAKG